MGFLFSSIVSLFLTANPSTASDGYVEAKQAFVSAMQETLAPERAASFEGDSYVRVQEISAGSSLPGNLRLFVLAPRLEAGSSTVADPDRIYHPTLLIWDMKRQALVGFRELKEECGAVVSTLISTANFDEDPEPELFVTLLTNCIDRDKLTSVRVERLLGFDYPSIEPLFGVDGTMLVYGQDNADLLERRFELVPSSVPGAVDLRVLDARTNEVLTVNVENESENRFSSGFEEIVASEKFRPKSGIVTCRVVDEKGNPIPGVEVMHSVTSLNIFGLALLDMEKVTRGTSISDSNGLVDIPYNRNGAHAFFGHKGHHQQQVSFELSEDDITHSIDRLIDGSVQTIVMPSELGRVQLHMNAEPALIPLDLHEAPLEFGISFEENPKLSAELNPRWIAEMGDVVVRIKTNNKVTITGRNGWQLQAAPPEFTKERIPVYDIYEAPETGYVLQLEFGIRQLPRVVFLSKDGGRRYGVLADLTITPMPFEPQNKVEFRFHYRVQAEPTGSRSLRPLGYYPN